MFLLLLLLPCWSQGKKVQHYSLETGVRRFGIPLERIQLQGTVIHPFTCTAYCYAQPWCTGFNVNLDAKQCDLFGHESSLLAIILATLGYTYGHKTSSNITKSPPIESIDYTNCVNSATSIEWQGQCFDKMSILEPNYGSAVETCKQVNGVLSVMVPQLLIDHFALGIPLTSQVLIGLRQKINQQTKLAGWYWINTATNDTVNIDTENTAPVRWSLSPLTPDDSNVILYENNRQQYGSMITTGLNDIGESDASITHALCQIASAVYLRTAVMNGSRIVSPAERQLNTIYVDECQLACRQNPFCRTFSYSHTLATCIQHSLSRAAGATVVEDADYQLFE